MQRGIRSIKAENWKSMGSNLHLGQSLMLLFGLDQPSPFIPQVKQPQADSFQTDGFNLLPGYPRVPFSYL